jgi:GDP-4-dehydro-6-deoxy-D-mannose reductase
VRCLVTGASGFVGHHLCAELRGRGHSLVSLGTDEGSDCRVDVCDRDGVVAALRETHPAAVYHLAAVAYVPRANAEPELADEVNRGGTANVLDAAADVGARTLVVSTGAVYGRVPSARMPITEDFDLDPADAYARSKVAAERECIDRAEDQEIVRVRPFNLTGPGQSGEYVCSDFAARIAEAEEHGREARLCVGDLSSERDFSDVRDAVRGYALVLERGVAGEAYNICSGRAVAISHVLELLISQARVKVQVETEKGRMRPGEVKRSYGSAAKLERGFGWERDYALERTLGDLLEDWRARLSSSASRARS